MGVNSLPKTATRQRRGCDLNPGPSAPESSTLTTWLPRHLAVYRSRSTSKHDFGHAVIRAERRLLFRECCSRSGLRAFWFQASTGNELIIQLAQPYSSAV